MTAPLEPRRAGRDREQVGEYRAHRVVEGHRAIGIVDADVDVDAEGVVAPRDVAQRALDDAVVRRVDDLLLPPRRQGVRAAGARAPRRARRPRRAGARRRSLSARAASANDSQRPVLTSISEEISSPAVCSPSGVASASAFSSAKRLTRPSVSGSTIWNSSSIARVKSCDASKIPRASSSAARGSGMLRPIAASVPAHSIYSRARKVPIPLAWSDRGGRTSSSWRWPACSAGPWACGPCRSSPSSRSRPSGRSPSGRASTASASPLRRRFYVR